MTVRRSVLQAAALITVLTVLARATGFVRSLVLARTVGFNCLADSYTTVNTVPNIMYEIVAGGALASLVVPLLAGAADQHDRDVVDRAASALLTWTVLVLVPLTVLVLVLAHPISAALLAGKGQECVGSVDVASSMLRLFAPQVLLYGIGVVLTGILQAHHRFMGPALAPLLSSLVVIASYLAFAAIARRGTDVGTVTSTEQLVLAGGTTLGVVVLSLPLLVPTWRAGVRLRPRLSFPVGLSASARHLALAGIATLTAQQVSVVVALRLANSSGAPPGTAAAFFQAQTIYLLPWAILAVPVATTVFPRLAGHTARGDAPAYARDLSGATRFVLVLSCAASAVLVATANPVARVIAQVAPGRPSVVTIQHGIIAFAIGLAGYGVFAVVSRALYAAGRARLATTVIVSGWVTVMVGDVVISALAPATERVAALGAGNSAGMVVTGAGLLLALRGVAPGVIRDIVRLLLAGLVAAAVAAAVGLVAASTLTGGGVPAAVGQAVVIAVVTSGVFAAATTLLARRPVTEAWQVLRGRTPGGADA
ncbi:MAG: murein biosynthesis integral membrane protein MurJ [Nocardioidaceae bacterium]